MLLNQLLTNVDAFPQFLVSKIDGGRKLPCNPQGVPADHTDPANWMTLSSAETLVTALGPNYFVGFSITSASGYFLLDIDNCIVDGRWSQLAEELCKICHGCYIEVSQSGKGLHIIGRYSQPFIHTNKNTLLGIELYTHARFVMLTGDRGFGDWNHDATIQVLGVAIQYFHKGAELTFAPQAPASPTDELSDDLVIANAYADETYRQIFGNGPSFKDLFEANEEVLIRGYPARSEGKPYDASSADLALANILAKHTNSNKEQMVRIMWKSGLVRDKWTERRTYLLDTCNKAISSRSATYSQLLHANPSSQGCQQLNQNNSTGENTGAGTGGETGGNQENGSIANIPQEFTGCYYVVETREVYHPVSGFVNQDAFNMIYGGRPFPESPTSSGITTNAYKSFKNYASQAGRVVEGVGFRPTLPYGTIIQEEGQSRLNVYKQLPIKQRKGNMAPFFRFFNAMIPDPRDQRIILSYAAHMVQRPGIQSHWAIVLHGVQGCGKSLFADLVSYACGRRYTHKVKGDEFENRFNIQWFGKTLLLVEDPQLRQVKLEEALKPLIGAASIAYEGKGQGIMINDFVANFIITTNDIGLIQKRDYTRRFAIFMSALQTVEDLIQAGLTPAAFQAIVDWKDKEHGYEIFTEYLHSYHIDPQYDFSNGCVVAPRTSTTDEVIEQSRSEIELKLLEQIEQGRMGFKNGWISSVALTDFLNQNRLNHLMPNRKRGEILKELGYIQHPAFRGHQISRAVEKYGKPRLFIQINHEILKIKDLSLIAATFISDQERD